MNKQFPCICGHAKKDHMKPIHVATFRELGICYHMSGKYDKYYSDNCQKYIPDNLKYLEAEYAKRSS